MDLESTKKLQLDCRLQNRRGWIARDKLDAALESLPDVSDKIAREEAPAEPAAPATDGGGSGGL